MIGGCLRGRLVPSIYTDKCKSGVQTTQLPGNIGQPPAINHRWWNSCVGVQVPQSCDTAGATEFGAVAVQCWTFVMIADGHMLMMQRLTTCIFLHVHITWLKRHYRKWRRMEFFGFYTVWRVRLAILVNKCIQYRLTMHIFTNLCQVFVYEHLCLYILTYKSTYNLTSLSYSIVNVLKHVFPVAISRRCILLLP